MAACGGYFTVGVTENGELYSWGDGSDGQLGLGAVRHQQWPARAGGPEKFGNQRVRLAAAGNRHLAVVAEDGEVYTCGSGSCGQLGLGDEQPRRRLTRVPQEVFAGSRVVLVACGGAHTMAVTAAGHAWTCGSNGNGQLGVGDETDREVFTQVDDGQLRGARIVMAACGARHSVVVSAEGRAWTFGDGAYGCQGLNDGQDNLLLRTRDRLVPTLLTAEVFEHSKIVTVAAGGFHTMAVDKSGRLWTWGAGFSGQLGLGDTSNRMVPTVVGAEEVFGGSKVRTVACGHDHTLVVTEVGELWAWGRGSHGRLGLNDRGDSLVPRRVDPQHFGNDPIAAVAAGELHSAAVTKRGALYTWGRSEASPISKIPGGPRLQMPGGLGHADLADRLVPTMVPRELLGGARVGRCHRLSEEHALAFAMGTHPRLGAGGAGAAARGTGMGKAKGMGQGCLSVMLPPELVRRVVELCAWRAGELGEGVVRLMGCARPRNAGID